MKPCPPTNSANTVKPSGISRTLILRLWERMTGQFGRKWSDQYGETPLASSGNGLTVAGQEWAGVIRGVSPEKVMAACDKVRDGANGFVPTAPEFRLACFDIPTRDACEAYLRGQADPQPFTVAVARAIDMWNWKGSPTYEANKILQAAYDAVKKRVLAGETLDPILPAIEQKPPERRPASPETAAEHIARIRAALGQPKPPQDVP